MEEILQTTYTIALPIVLGYIVWLLKGLKGRKDANTKGIMLLLRCHLIDVHHHYTKKGEIPLYAYTNFVEMYEAYHTMGGNGCIAKMKEEIEELRIKTESHICNEHNEH